MSARDRALTRGSPFELGPAQPPRVSRIGKPTILTESPEYGRRKVARQIYHAGKQDGTVWAGKSPAEIDRAFRDAMVAWGRQRGREVRVAVLPDGRYQVDLLATLEPIPALASFPEVVRPLLADHRDNLRLVIGVSNGGAPVVSDAEAWPHAIIGGSTYGGKSILVGSLLAQLAAKDPATVRLALADMSRVELPLYERLPHAIAPSAGTVLDVLDLAQRVETEMTLRGALMEAELRVVRPDGSVFDTANRPRDLVTWNQWVRRIGAPDLALPHLIFVADEWKQAMDGSDEARQLVRVVSRLMRLGRKFGIRVWLIAQEPKKGADGTTTFPDDIMANAATRIAMAYAATPLVWQLVFNNQRSLNPSDRDPVGDLAMLKAPDGTVPRGRAMMVSPTAQATPFQGLFLDPGPDQDDLSSALSRFVDKAARQAKLSPGARLLSERGLPLRPPINRIEIVLRPGEVTQLRVIREGGVEAGLGETPEILPGDESALTTDGPAGSADEDEAEARAHPGDDDRPAVPTQEQITPLTVEAAARLVSALYRPGDQVSLDGLTERMSANGLGVRRQRLVEVLAALAVQGVLELSVDGSRTLATSWADARELVGQVPVTEEDDLPPGPAPTGGADPVDEGSAWTAHDA
jgi:hypothetical protein